MLFSLTGDILYDDLEFFYYLIAPFIDATKPELYWA